MGVATLQIAKPQKTTEEMYVRNVSTEIGFGGVTERHSDALDVTDPNCLRISCLVVLTV